MRWTILLLLPLLAVTAAALAATAPPGPEARSSAIVARVLQPGQPEQVALTVVAPPADSQSLVGWLYPEDGSIVRVGSASASGAAQAGVSSSAQGVVDALAVSLFNGEITVESLGARATAAAGPASASADASTSTLSGLTVLGQPITPSTNVQIPLGDWGTLDVLASSTESALLPPRSSSSLATAVRVKLLADHGGLVAGSVIEIGSATASALAAAAPIPPSPVAPPPTPTPTPTQAPPQAPPPGALRRPVVPAPAPREPGRSIPGAPAEIVRPAPQVAGRLTSGGYVFPVFGPASFGDTFGAFRGDVAGKWHHGEDLMAPAGTPLLAVAAGRLFSVGWNDIGGWRLWLRDDDGNEFYYAHLSAYSSLAVNGQRVEPGDVLGFVGKSGDAEYSAPHLHFEIHPVSLLGRGYDGVVAPYPFLLAWRRVQDIPFAAGRVYVPVAGGAAGVPPSSGALLLESSDISSASGLVAGALERTLTGLASERRSAAATR